LNSFFWFRFIFVFHLNGFFIEGGDDKSRCTPVPITSSAKEGEKVKAGWVGSFKESTVTKVDPKIGRVFIKFDVDSKEKAVAFGDVMK
jgi:hypothetical protein